MGIDGPEVLGSGEGVGGPGRHRPYVNVERSQRAKPLEGGALPQSTWSEANKEKPGRDRPYSGNREPSWAELRIDGASGQQNAL